MSTPEERLAELGLELPPVPAPIAAYIPAVRSGSFVFTSGQLPTVGAEPIATGRVGSDVSVEQAVECARICTLNALAAIREVIGELSGVRRVVKVVGYVASADDFFGQPQVINGASDLLGQIFGDPGVHARAAVGVTALPKNSPVEIEMIVEV